MIAEPEEERRNAKFEIGNAKREIRKWGLRLVRWACLVGYTLGNAEITEFDGSAAVVARPGCGKMSLSSS
jgi:hypothetical protein